ncbi:hypothetical protein ACHAWX_004636 [Stephanocyclus meneghinianus]
MSLDAFSNHSNTTASPPPEEHFDVDVQSSDGILLHDTMTSPTPQSTETAPAVLSPCLSDLYLVSPPPRIMNNPGNNACGSINTPSIRASLTPPPHSEKIHRAIRTAASQLDAAVHDVQHYISQGCPDSDVEANARERGGTPGSEYSDDFMSPKVLPDFTKSPMKRDSGNIVDASKLSYRRRILDDDDDDSNEEHHQSECSDSSRPERSFHLDEDMSKLQIGTSDDLNVKSVEPKDDLVLSAPEEKYASRDDSDEESVMLVTAKSRNRRVIDDDESSDESESGNNIASDDGSSNTDGSDGEDDRSEKKQVMKPEVVLRDAFSELVLDDTSQERGFGTDDRNLSLDTDDTTDNHLKEKEKNDKTYTTNNNDDDDDESITIFEGCGCWTLDQSTHDLYLPSSSGKWPRIRLPFSTYQKLYQHQRIGIQWIASLHRNTIKGGILADDMGMGKTMQTLVYLGSMMRAQSIHNALVVCPKSVVRNWEREANLVFKDIVPKCKVCAITSDVGKEKRIREFTEAFCRCVFDVLPLYLFITTTLHIYFSQKICSSFKKPRLVITTYGLISSHITELNHITNNFPEWQWCYVILDEGHCIKNPSTNISKHVRTLCRNKKTRRLLLTGTPIQNNLRELHSLFDWATSGQLLGSLRTFLNKYAIPIEDGRQKNASAWEIKKASEVNKSLQQLLQPYFLQRLKSTEFQNSLPTKKELVVFVSLSQNQRKLYEKYLDGGMIKSVLSGETASPLTAIAYLKQLCGHPLLVRKDDAARNESDSDALLEDSAKLQVLFSLVQRLKRAGHRTLIFSQSTKMLDIMEKVFDGSVTYLRIDGQSPEKSRQRNVDDFNDKESAIDCMLLSTKAAGVGLTLNGANRAIIYDPSWNPAEDAQAIDRCYRIGQSKNVTVYRMITSGTVEEKMYEKQGKTVLLQ